MAVRVFPAGFQYMDPVAGSSTAGSGIIVDDGTTTPPWVDRPDQQRSDLFLNESLRRNMTMTRDDAAAIRPPLPPVPSPFGYATDALTIDDVLGGRLTPNGRRVPGEFMEGSLRNAQSASPAGS